MGVANRLYGFLGAYFISLYGKRPSVLTKLTVKELLEEVIGDEEKGYLINVS